jgi:hypothetical protein
VQNREARFSVSITESEGEPHYCSELSAKGGMMHYHFEGSLTARDCKRHIPHQFVAPDGSQAIEIRLRFAPYIVHGMANMLTLTVMDPGGFRGAGHRHGADHQVYIGPTEATPGYLPGSLPSGPWIAQIDTHMIMPGEALRYSLDITIAEEANVRSETTRLPQVGRPPRRGLVSRRPA